MSESGIWLYVLSRLNEQSREAEAVKSTAPTDNGECRLINKWRKTIITRH